MQKSLKVKVHTLQSALERLRKYCAYQERSQAEVRDKFYSLGLHSNEVEQGISVLIEEGYLNEERFAIAFAGGRFRIKRWGKIKITGALKMRNISPYCIKKALGQIDDEEYIKTIQFLISQAGDRIKEKSPVKKNFLIAKYVISRGFEPDLIWDQLRSDKE
jgi:regulatory protein